MTSLQAIFESLLYHTLSGLDGSTAVWVVCDPARMSGRVVPPALAARLNAAARLHWVEH